MSSEASKHLLRVKSRQFIIPEKLNSSAGASVEPQMQMESLSVQLDTSNKKLLRQVEQYCKEAGLEVSTSDNSIELSGCNLSDHSKVIRFKELTFNHPYTHFVSIPLRVLEQKFNQFQKEALSLLSMPKHYESKGFHPVHLFTSPLKLHLTVCMVTIMKREDVARAQAALQSLTIPPITIKLSGLDLIKGTPEHAHCLYCRVHSDSSLETLGTAIRTSLLDLGLTDAIAPTTWHCTLMNTKYFDLHYKCQGSSFDARKILRKVQCDFGEVQVHEVHLSKLNSKNEDGYYGSEFIIKA